MANDKDSAGDELPVATPAPMASPDAHSDVSEPKVERPEEVGGASHGRYQDGDEDQQDQGNDNENEDENQDENEDEDEDEEEEDEEESGSRKRRKTRRRRNQFLDVEAEDDDEEEELDEDDDDLTREEGFVEEPDAGELEQGTAEEQDGVHRAINMRRDRFDQFSNEDAEKLADELRQKYGKSTAGTFRGDSGVVPQRLLLPSVHDPSIFGINCRIGKEKDAVRALLRKQLNMQYGPNPLQIFSAFQRDAFPGRIYVEAPNRKAAVTAVTGIVHVFANSNMLLVPIKEYPDLFRMRKSQDTELVPGTYVRLKRGKYAGDLAVVENLSENGLEVQLRLVPRLDYGRAPVVDSMGQAKRKRATATDRPPQRLFSASDAGKYDPRNLQRRGATSYVYAGEEYDNGYLVKDFKLTLVSTEGVNPTLDEITKLNNAKDDGIDLNALSESLRKDTKAQTFQPGELVEVSQGEQAGFHGKVVSSAADIVTIVGTGDEFKGIEITVPSALLRKHFRIGDHVRVTAGNYKDDTGMVVKRSKDQVTLLSDLTQSEVTVFSKDLKAASDIGGSNAVGQYTLQDLVQLNAQKVGCIVDIERDSLRVLAQDGQVVTVPASSVVGKASTMGRQVSTDQVGRQIEVGDKARESGGERREGTILHIYHQYVFLQNRSIQENLGVFVNRVHNVVTVSTKNARDDKGLDLSKMNPTAGASAAASMAPPPARSNFNARRIIGKRVSVGGGSHYKGLKAIVRNVNDTTAQIELEARNKVIAVDVTKLLIQSPEGMVPFKDFISRPSGGLRGSQGGPGRPDGGRTPGGRPQMGSQTPAWAGGSGGRTPAWSGGNGGGSNNNGSRTPAWAGAGSGGAGGRTPAWSGSGAQTPSWNSGSRTPTWNAGAQTPSWNSGAQTPSWNAGSGGGGRTPAWNSSSGRTPAWQAGGAAGWEASSRSAATPGASFYSAAHTPGISSAPTPGVYESGPTPGPYTSAKTPGAVATPAAWGDNDEDVPRYEPESP